MAQFLHRGARLCSPILWKSLCSKCELNAFKKSPRLQPTITSTFKLYSVQTENKIIHTSDSVKQPDPIDLFGENKDERQKEKEKAIKNLKIGFFVIGASMVLILGSGLYVLVSEDDSNKTDEDDHSIYPVKLYKRGRLAISNFFESMRAPSYEKLLPDPLAFPYIQPPYTLLIEMNDLLIHPEWTYSTGWRFKKRPNVDYFLDQVGQNYEVVVFTSSNGYNVYPILDNLDKNGVIMYRLVKNATDYIEGHHVKNLERINRDLSKVIMVDCDEKSVKLQRNNALVIPKWTGDDNDHQLVQLAEFLNVISASEVIDVREVLSYYKQFENPLETFKENQRKLLELQEEQKQLSEKLPVKKTSDRLKQQFLYGK
ncbi:mitochondrial import inner membrane translocase subunit TIM50-B-like [Adelges cooleyi]|uniref:mitochondrial import inner membrane translocase subunit TIM50-B-like n=1 Tax=Adelges cooleyi TaxID=133065 RepID=UPI00217F7C85|nr:mitochondrial import inner membrane translocase subunit TIM50-B-like [Adelges cooleyi]